MEGQGLPPDRVIAASRQRLMQTQQERARTKTLMQVGKILEADTPDRLDLRKQHLLARTNMAQVVDPETVTELSGARVSDLSARARRAFERVLGVNNLVSAAFLPLGTYVRRTVGRIEVRNRVQRLGWGTGFLVSPQLLLTNNHVLSDRDSARFSRVEFDYEEGFNRRVPLTWVFQLDPDALFLTSDAEEGLDYTLVAVNPLSEPDGDGRTVALTLFGYNVLQRVHGKIVKGEAINIVQHPSGQPRQVAVQDNQLTALLDDWLHYEADTAPGSSGSPLYNNQWEVVGLHHSGVPATDDQGRWLAIDGHLWSEDMGEARVKWLANEGARISRVLADAETQVATATPEAKQLFAELLTPALPPWLRGEGPTPPPGGLPNGVQTGRASQDEGRVMDERMVQVTGRGTGIEVTVPLTISISLGRPAPVGGGETGQGLRRRPPAIVPDAVGEPVRAALAEAEQFAARDYYPATQDEGDRQRYYQGINWQANGPELYETLHALLTRTHREQPRYSPARYLYPWVDRHDNGSLVSIYTNELYASVQELIREELAQEQAFARATSELALRFQHEASWTPAEFQAELLALEQQLAFNCEHTVPQSWFSKREPMRGDLHHLFTCQIKCNSARSNTPYWEFPDFPGTREAVSAACGKAALGKFEPRHGKGPVARSTLYFLLRYPREIGDRAGELQGDRLDTLKHWATAHRVTAYERHRNRAIAEIQGNRNPLIDLADLFPDAYAQTLDRIDFLHGFGA